MLPFTVDERPNAYLADGVVEGVIGGLTRLRDLRVTPRASAFRFKDATGDPVAAGRALDVPGGRHGSLSRSGDGVRLQVELVDVARNAQVWSTAYQAAPAELPQLEARVMHDLAKRAAQSARGRASTRAALGPHRYTAGIPSVSAGAIPVEPALRGEPPGRDRSIPPRHRARPAVCTGPCRVGRRAYDARIPRLPCAGSTFPVARPYALKALELDPSLAQAHASLAYIKFYFDWDWEGARQEFTRAIELNPNDPVSHQWYAVYLLASGDPDRAFGEVQLAHRLDPLSLAINTDIGFHHYYNGRYGEAVSQLQSVLDMKSDFLLAHLWLARALLDARKFDAALAETAIAEAKARDWTVLVAARGFKYGIAGMTREAQAVLQRNGCALKQRFVTSYGVALVHAGLGQIDEAFHWLDRAFDERHTGWSGFALTLDGRACTGMLALPPWSRG